jgi:LuxR family maltose regulon positive regulatory protein
MSHSIRILNSKLTAPRTSGSILRERLLSRMTPAEGRRLTTVVAGAGYGKTTLVAQALPRCTGKAVWYRLDESDRDFVTFISYLLAGIRQHKPQFGDELLEFLRKARNPADDLPFALNMFLSELEELAPEGLFIVLDDYHLVSDSPEIGASLEILVRDLSPRSHLTITSRSRPALSLSRLRARREMTEIREEDLAFTAEEIERLYSQVFDLSLGRTDMDAICRKVGGWIAGLILLRHTLRGKPASEIGPDIMSLRGSRRAIFNYLEENVYGSLSQEQQDLLIKTSILHRMTPALCDQLLKVDHSAEVLGYLEDNHLFTSSIDRDEQWYSYHQLFRDFLRSRLEAKVAPAAIVRLHRDAALLLETGGEEEEAVEHYLEAGEIERACGLLEQTAGRLFAEGRFQLLESHLGRIPAELLDRHPWLQFQQAQMEGLRGRPRSASEKYDRARACFIEHEDRDGVRSCLVESALIDFQTGNLRKARERFQTLLGQPDTDPGLRIEILGYLIYILSHLGELELADRFFHEAIFLADDLETESLRSRCLIWLYYYKGFMHAFSAEYEKALDAAESMRTAFQSIAPEKVPSGYHLLVSMACFHLQLYSRGYECAREGLNMTGEDRSRGCPGGSAWPSPRLSPRGERGFPDVLRCWLLAFTALNGAHLGKGAEALGAAERSLGCFRRMGCRYGEPFAYFVLHEVHLNSGNRAAAERYARTGIDAMREKTMPAYEALLKLRLARFLADNGEMDEASELLDDADGQVLKLMNPVGLNLLRARLCWAGGRHAAGLTHLASALEICEQRRLDSRIASERNWILPLMAEAHARGEMPGYISERMSTIIPDLLDKLYIPRPEGNSGRRSTTSRRIRQAPKPPAHSLRVCLLGRFRVVSGTYEIPPTAWRSRKAKTLFQYLAHSRQHGYTNREILMELLWPEEDPVITTKRFHVALASLRIILEPEIETRTPSAFITRVGESYGLELGGEGWTDVERFTKALRLAAEEEDPLRSLHHLLSAEFLYGGDFLIEEPYCQWCLEARDKYKRHYLELLKRIAASCERLGDRARAIEYFNKYLDADKYAEDVCRALMALYSEIGDKFGMARTFKKCRDDIARELDCGLSDETEQLYRRLLAGYPPSACRRESFNSKKSQHH